MGLWGKAIREAKNFMPTRQHAPNNKKAIAESLLDSFASVSTHDDGNIPPRSNKNSPKLTLSNANRYI